MINAKMFIIVVILSTPFLDFVELVEFLVIIQTEKFAKPQLKILNVEKENMRKRELVSLMDVLVSIKMMYALGANQFLMR